MPAPSAGDPSATPFVYYVGSMPIYPPNTIYESAKAAISESETKPLKTVLQERTKRGFVGGTVAVLPETWWSHYLLNYVNYFANNFSEPAEFEEQAAAALRIMAEGPPEEAWPKLIGLAVGEMDVLSGWNKSWVKEDAERSGVFKGDDGNYYCRDLDGILIQIVGARPLPETHLDFITDHILRGHGCLRQLFNVMSIFSTAHEYEKDPKSFPRSMKAVMTDPGFGGTSYKWNLMQFQRTRSVRWRPVSNLCDPDWLAAEMLARVTDTLDKDLWKDRIEKSKRERSELNEDCPFQMDYVVDSSLKIGTDDEVYFEFEGRTFRWTNGSPETKPGISVGI